MVQFIKVSVVLLFLFSLLGIFQNCSGEFSAIKSSESRLQSIQKICSAASAPAYRASMLTKEELQYIVADVFPAEVSGSKTIQDKLNIIPVISVGSVSDKTVFPANNKLDMPSEAYISSLIELSEELTDGLLKVQKYSLACEARKSCQDIVLGLVSQLWRRPPTTEELSMFDEIFSDSTPLVERAKLSLMTALSSPQFFIKNQLSLSKDKEQNVYGEFELASRLSFFLYDSVPDKKLFDSALRGELRNSGALEEHVDRILSEPKYLDRFVKNTLGKWIGIDADLSSSATITNGAGVELSVEEAAKQQYMKLAHIVEHNKSLSEFFYSDWDYMTANIEKYLGRSPSSLGAEPVKVESPAAGYFNSPHFAMNTISSVENNKTVVSQRGIYVAKRLLCIDTPVNEVSPAAVARVLGSDPDSLSQIEVGEIRRKHPSCKGCHGKVDKIGMGLELIGPFGNKRTSYSDGSPIRFSFKVNEEQNNIATDFDSFMSNFSKDNRLDACFLKTISNKVAPMNLVRAQPCLEGIAEYGETGIRDQIKSMVQSRVFGHVDEETVDE